MCTIKGVLGMMFSRTYMMGELMIYMMLHTTYMMLYTTYRMLYTTYMRYTMNTYNAIQGPIFICLAIKNIHAFIDQLTHDMYTMHTTCFHNVQDVHNVWHLQKKN